jgi:hypothetical protein
MNTFWTWWSNVFGLDDTAPALRPAAEHWDSIVATPLANTVAAPPPALLKPVVPPPVIAPISDPPQAASAVPRLPTSGPTIAIMNFSTVLSDSEVQTAIAALQVQIDRDFRPLWGLPANLLFVSNIKRPPINAWVVQVLDSSDVTGALGYHDMTNAGLPVGKVFAKDDKKYGLSWTITLSHEVLEMLGDPYTDTTVFVQDTNTTGLLFAYELCDAVEDDSLGYPINGVMMSDFVTPAYFEAGRLPNSTKFDFRASLTAPLTLTKGGYMSVFAVTPQTTGWSQQTDAKGIAPRLAMKLARCDSRVNRRASPPA